MINLPYGTNSHIYLLYMENTIWSKKDLLKIFMKKQRLYHQFLCVDHNKESLYTNNRFNYTSHKGDLTT
jgi:uncharacterized membrane protein